MVFASFGLKEEIVKSLEEMGYEAPTTIQEKAWPLILNGQDVIGVSKTGSGKTAAFGVPLLQNVAEEYGLQVLIMAPTRELAVQIAGEMRKFGKYLPFLRVAEVYGGVGYDQQIADMSSSQVLVATPGRLLDHLKQGNVELDGLFSFVLDEADKMVEMGFVEDIEEILEYTPEDRQFLMFGATIAGEVERIRDEYLYEPKVAQAETRVDAETLEQYYYNVKPFEKFSMLIHLLKKEPFERVIVFCSARDTVDVVSQNLERQGYANVRLHGKLAQATRLKMLDRFNKGEVKILVASSVAARGLDIKEVTHVFNYDVSQDPQEYIHRIGRTARAGESGKAYTLLAPRDHDAFSNVFRNYNVEPVLLPRENFKNVPFDASGFHRGPRRDDDRGGYGDRRGPRRDGGRPSRRR